MQQTSNFGVYPAKLKTKPLGLGQTGLDYRLFVMALATADPDNVHVDSCYIYRELLCVVA